MKILLATYNFYPYHAGGSEVYVLSLATYLQSIGYEPIILAAVPADAISENPVIYNDPQLNICSYEYKGIPVWGARYSSIDLDAIYARKQSGLLHNWQSFFQQQEPFDIVHIHGFTATIGIDMLRALKNLTPAVRVFTSYHTAISCPKGTLLLSNKKKECDVVPGTDICTACYLSDKTSVPLAVTKRVMPFWPSFKKGPAALQIKHLIGLAVNSFKELDQLTDQWFVFSEGIKQVLLLNGIPPQKIFTLRHGISDFFAGQENRKSAGLHRFLYSGRLEVIKGFDTLLKAWLSLPPSADRNLVITASAKSSDRIIQLLLDKAVQRKDIQFTGTLSQQELVERYRESHCVIIPSACYEIGPMVFHEAIAMGCNVIASNIGGCRELGLFYSGQTRFFECGDEQALAKTIRQFEYAAPQYYNQLFATTHNRQITEVYSLVENETV